MRVRPALILAIAAALVAPAGARAAAPAITSVASNGGALTITWSLPAGMHSWSAEVATSPVTEPDGSFTVKNRAYAVILTPEMTSVSTGRLRQGTYYVHVSAYGACNVPSDSSCGKEFSTASTVVVPPPSPPVLNSVGLNQQSVTARWTLPPTSGADFIELATDPDVYASGPDKGAFLDEHTVLLYLLDRSQTVYMTPAQLSGGTYYAHVAAFDFLECPPPGATTCVREFSQTIPVAVPSHPPVLTSAHPTEHHVSVSWELPGTMESDYIEVATSPAVYTSGFLRGGFLSESVVYQDLLDYDQQSYVTFADLPPGTYYVHVGDVFPPACNTAYAFACFDEFSQTATVTIPGDAQAPPASLASAGSAPDVATAFASVSVPASQRVGKLLVRAAMPEAGTITASGTVAVAGAARTLRFVAASARAAPGVAVKLALRLPKRDLRAVRKALARHRRVRARITVRATDRAGNTAIQKRIVKLRP